MTEMQIGQRVWVYTHETHGVVTGTTDTCVLVDAEDGKTYMVTKDEVRAA